MNPQYDSVPASSRFMFEGDEVATTDPFVRFERALARYERVERMQALRAGARDIFTGEPLRGDGFAEWLSLPLGD